MPLVIDVPDNTVDEATEACVVMLLILMLAPLGAMYPVRV
jgi:hypothetical protein